MKVTVVGARGMLGTDLLAVCRKAGIEASGFDLPEVDIVRPDLARLDSEGKIDWLINCAAYTDVDGAEASREKSFAVNAKGPDNLAAWCAGRGVKMMHISTDYVFDGTATRPYRETDEASPLNVYGRDKLAGEQAVAAKLEQHLIVRTQSLYGRNGKSFIRAIMDRLAKSDDPLRVVTDQVSSPTWTVHLAEGITKLLGCGKYGLVHVASSGQCSWFEFACRIAQRVKPGAAVLETTAAEFKRAARRPAYSVLDKSRYEEWTSSGMPSWQAGLDGYLAHLKEN